MKKLLVVVGCLIVLFFISSGFDNGKRLEGYKVVFQNSSGTDTPGIMNGDIFSKAISRENSTGYASLQLNITGSGTADVAYLVSNDGNTFVKEDGASLLFDDVTATSGPDSDGNMACKIPMGAFTYMKLKISEVGGTASITPTAIMVWQ